MAKTNRSVIRKTPCISIIGTASYLTIFQQYVAVHERMVKADTADLIYQFNGDLLKYVNVSPRILLK